MATSRRCVETDATVTWSAREDLRRSTFVVPVAIPITAATQESVSLPSVSAAAEGIVPVDAAPRAHRQGERDTSEDIGSRVHV